jgi:hypothetical protein
MPEFVISPFMGIDNAHDDLRMPEGYFRIIRGAYLRPDDPDRIWKAPGRTLAGTFPGALSVAGMDFLQQDSGDTFALWVNGKVYSAPAGILGVDTWTPASDRTDPDPIPFPQVGTMPKAIHDGTGRWILWSGDPSEVPLLREVDGSFRTIGVDKPGKLTGITTIDTPGTDIIPDAVAAVATYDTWDNPTNSYDSDTNTAATKLYETVPSSFGVSGVWSFTDGGTIPVGSTIQVVIATSSLPPWGVDPPGGGGDANDQDPLDTAMLVELSEDAGATWIPIFTKHSPIARQTVTGNLTFGLNWTDIQIRITGEYISGIGRIEFQVYEVYASSGSGTAIMGGVYHYCSTEVYVDPAGRTIESGISDDFEIEVLPLTGEVSVPPVYGLILDLPVGTSNPITKGFDQSRLSRRIYRTTKTGAPPDYGRVSSAAITDTTFVDIFTEDGDTLPGLPPESLAAVGDLTVSLSEPVPAIRDAALYRGSVVIIPANLEATIYWSVPGVPDYFPLYTQSLASLPSERNDTLKAICTINNALLLFFRTRVLRIMDLPMIADQTFDIRIADQDILSPSEGLAGGIKSYCSFNAESGRALVAWVSDSGIWMTDGSLNFERGLGCVKLSPKIDWSRTVDTSRLGETTLTFDPVEQIMWFLYWDPAGLRQALAFHLSKIHWSEEAPKVTGPHDLPLQGHLTGEFSTALRLWGWESIYDPDLVVYTVNLYNERTGSVDEAHWTDPAGQIETYLESGWNYPQGPYGEWQIYKGALYHNNWGPNHMVDIRMEFREDSRGIVQSLRKGISLLGSRISSFWLSRSGRSLRVTLRHLGHAEGALGPLVFEGESLGPTEGA